MPLHPTVYGEMLSNKMRESGANVWLVNTGWSGGPYGTGKRMSLKITRALISAALNGDLENVDYNTHKVFGLKMPATCPNVPSEVLNPRLTWDNEDAYDDKAFDLAAQFNKNFEKFAEGASEELLAAAPKMR
jgi:phosphoenolpyruvate carboxykinase (ATP)